MSRRRYISTEISILDKPKSDHERYPLYDDPRLTDAYESASSAQFEREYQR